MIAQCMNFRRLLATFLLSAVCILRNSPANGQALSIVVQPESQNNDYGSDASFTVAVDGAEPISYQWMKNGNALHDFDNIAGSQTSTLHLIGVANNDTGRYWVTVTNAGGAVTSAIVTLVVKPTVVFEDHFESGLVNWHPLLNGTAMQLDTNQNHTPAGVWSAAVTDSSQAMYHSLGGKLKGRVRLSGWIYDNGGNQRAYLRLQGYEGPGYGSYATDKALMQTLSIGIQAPEETTNGVRKGEILDPATYQAYVSRGMKTGWVGNRWFNADLVQTGTNGWTNSGWFNLDGSNAPHRSIGWHKFALDWSSGSMVNFYVDGILARQIGGVRHPDFDTVIMGSSGLGKSNEIVCVPVTAWFDDVKVEDYTPTFDSEEFSSTGRAFPDWMLLREVGTNAAAANITQIRTVAEAAGSATTATLGIWATNGVDIYARSVRGWMEYTLQAPQNDSYRIEVEGAEHDYQWPPVDLPLHIWMDGEYLGRFNLSYGAQSNGLVRCFTPFILAGSHTVRLLWDNAGPRRSLDIGAVRMQALDSSSVNDTGMKMWVANRLQAQCGMEVGSSDSLTSPACVEGRGQFLSMMSLTAGTPLAPVSVQHGAGNRWYANVPLSPSAPTPIVASYQNGGLTESNTIKWQPINLLKGGSLTIRQGDSLLMRAVQAGVTNQTVTITISDGTTLTTDERTPMPYQFNTPGTFNVTGSLNGAGSGSVTVTVVAAVSLEPSVPVYSYRNDWVCTNLPSEVVLDADPRLNVVLSSSTQIAQLHPPLVSLGTNDRVYRVQHAVFQPRYVLARLGQNGPVMASTAIQGCDCSIAPESALRLVSTRQDGYQIVEGTYVLRPAITNVTVSLRILTAGVTFDDGTLQRIVQPSEFDNLGVYRAIYIRSPGLEGSVCVQRHFQYNDTMRSDQ